MIGFLLSSSYGKIKEYTLEGTSLDICRREREFIVIPIIGTISPSESNQWRQICLFVLLSVQEEEEEAPQC